MSSQASSFKKATQNVKIIPVTSNSSLKKTLKNVKTIIRPLKTGYSSTLLVNVLRWVRIVNANKSILRKLLPYYLEFPLLKMILS